MFAPADATPPAKAATAATSTIKLKSPSFALVTIPSPLYLWTTQRQTSPTSALPLFRTVVPEIEKARPRSSGSPRRVTGDVQSHEPTWPRSRQILLPPCSPPDQRETPDQEAERPEPESGAKTYRNLGACVSAQARK